MAVDRQRRATLVLRDTGSGQTWDLTDGRLIVARADALSQLRLEHGDAPIALDDEFVSHRHATIHADGGGFWLTDADSANGSYVNDTKVDQTTPITDGAVLRFGGTVLEASIEAAAVPPANRSQSVDPDLTLRQPKKVLNRELEPGLVREQAPPPEEVLPDKTPIRFTPVPSRPRKGSGGGSDPVSDVPELADVPDVSEARASQPEKVAIPRVTLNIGTPVTRAAD